MTGGRRAVSPEAVGKAALNTPSGFGGGRGILFDFLVADLTFFKSATKIFLKYFEPVDLY